MNFLTIEWPFYISGILIGFFPFLTLFFLNKEFGISSSFRHLCRFIPGTKKFSYFNYSMKEQSWNLRFSFGLIIGAILSSFLFQADTAKNFSPESIHELRSFGVSVFEGYIPSDLFPLDNAITVLILLFAGFMIGFGTRWANGCTSGHAITGLSKGQLSSLLAVIGFFAGGVLASYLIIPFIF